MGLEALTRRGRQVRWSLAGCAVAALLLAIAGDAAEARPQRLASEQVKALVTGNTVRGFTPGDESTFAMFYSRSGRIRAELRNVNGELSKSGGRWWVNDLGQLCVDWDNFRWINSCAAVARDGDTVTFLDDNGRVISFGEVVTGNPGRL